jgi:hypothetical protein
MDEIKDYLMMNFQKISEEIIIHWVLIDSFNKNDKYK